MARNGKRSERKRSFAKSKHALSSKNEQPVPEEPSPQGGEPSKYPGLLTLPGELRNHIYELALTADVPFEFRQAHEKRVEFGPAAMSAYLCLVKQRGTSHYRDASCSFRVQLSVISERKHVTILVNPFNRLHLVNKQLRYETKNLEFKYNTIAFTEGWASAINTKMEQMVTFGANMRSWTHPRLRSVILVAPDDLIYDIAWRYEGAFTLQSTNSPKFSKYANSLQKLANVCRKNPAVKLSYAITPFDGFSWFGSGTPLSPSHRGIWCFVVTGLLAEVVFDHAGWFATAIKDNRSIRDDPSVKLAEDYGRTFTTRGIFKDVNNFTVYLGDPYYMQRRYGKRGVQATDFFGPVPGPIENALQKETWAICADHWIEDGIRPS